MRRWSSILLTGGLMLGLLSGCGGESAAADPGAEVDWAPDRTLRVIEETDGGGLLLAGEGPTEVYLADGFQWAREEAELRPGMRVEVSFGGDILESFPAQLGEVSLVPAAEEPGCRSAQLVPLYLQVLEDLWAVDPGLNQGITYLSVDLSRAPGELTEGEREALAWCFADRHGAEPLTLGMEELTEEGYLLERPHSNPLLKEGQEPLPVLQWEDGVLFTIRAAEPKPQDGGPDAVTFQGEKWRSPLGAYEFHDCNIVPGEDGALTYTVGAEMIA